ncbi:hypothetical protein CRE_31523 [Caenorhabditis remanei]|uniref:Uncharacterized protein n=1 Tax=Caenorhabditis remanei TaxID=31234 RepID=E3NGG5_CAERE|nr:hypothetical protein CRE_31523 [Caenorhabditis remanei]
MSEEGLVEGRSSEAVFHQQGTKQSEGRCSPQTHLQTSPLAIMLLGHRQILEHFGHSSTIRSIKDNWTKKGRHPKNESNISYPEGQSGKTCRSTNRTTIKTNQEVGTQGSLLPEEHHHLINRTTPSIDGNNNCGQQYRRITTTSSFANEKRQDNVPDNAMLPARSERSRTRSTITFAGREPLSTLRDIQFNDAARTKEHIWTIVSNINFVEGMAQPQDNLSL